MSKKDKEKEKNKEKSKAPVASDADIQDAPKADVASLKDSPEAEALAQATADLKKAQETNDNMEAISKAVAAMSEAALNMSEATSKMAEEAFKAREADEFDDLSNEKLLATIKDLPDGEEKASLIGEIAGEYGWAAVNTALSVNMVKTLHAPIHERQSDFGDKKAMREAHDFAMILCAYEGGNVTLNSKADKTKFDKAIYVECMDRLAKDGHFGAELMMRGINEALDTATATEGLEWVPTILSGDLAEDLYLSLKVVGLYPRLRMRAKTFEVPIRTARSRGYRVSEALANTEFFTSTFTADSLETAKVTFVAEKLGVLNFISDELEQDAAMDMMPLLREDILWGLGSSIEDATLNGSSIVTDLDNAAASKLWTSTADVRNAWDGVRNSIEKSGVTHIDGGTFTYDILQNARREIGKYGTDPSNLVWVVSPKGYIDITKLTEVVTLEKYGANATVLKGELARVGGIPIVVSENLAENLNIDGVYDNITLDNTVMLLLNRKAHMFGDRKDIRVEQDRSILSQQSALAVSWRGDFQKMYQVAIDTDGIVDNVDTA